MKRNKGKKIRRKVLNGMRQKNIRRFRASEYAKSQLKITERGRGEREREKV